MSRGRPASVSKTGMGAGWALFHAVMIAGTCGLWYPVYRAHKASAAKVTRTYDQ